MSSVQPPAEGDLQRIIMELNQAAYHLAQQAAQQPNQFDQFAEQAYELDRRLQAVALLIDNTEVPGQPDELIEAWTTARLDVDFILSGGSQPTSLRLHQFLTGLG